MAVGLKIGPIFYKIGTGSFLNCFFSTIAHNLEKSKRGSKYPYLMKELYNGELLYENISKAEKELNIVREELKAFSPEKVVWDIENLSQRPPWGNEIADRITDLSNYFYTSDGNDLFEVFFKAFNTGKEVKKNILVHSL